LIDRRPRVGVMHLRFRLTAALGGFAIMAVAVTCAWTGRIVREYAAETAAFKVVYDDAISEHRDPDAAVRKARYITEAMSEDSGADPGETAEDVARFLVLHGRRLCGGGLR
jgi:hypothetical protein